MFVRARIDEGVQPDAILIPQQGVSRTPRGDATVLIVNDKSQVEARPVVASQAIGDKWLISEGLKSGDPTIARRSVSNNCTACGFCFSKLSGR